jgi:hypothetical protein
LFCIKGLICREFSTVVEGRVRGLGVRDEGRGVGGEGREVRGWKEKSKSKMEKEEIAYSV